MDAADAWAQPYDAVLDRNGEAWTGSMLSDRVARLDPKTGEFVEYLLPRRTNIRRVFVDNTTTPATLLGRQQPRRRRSSRSSRWIEVRRRHALALLARIPPPLAGEGGRGSRDGASGFPSPLSPSHACRIGTMGRGTQTQAAQCATTFCISPNRPARNSRMFSTSSGITCAS